MSSNFQPNVAPLPLSNVFQLIKVKAGRYDRNLSYAIVCLVSLMSSRRVAEMGQWRPNTCSDDQDEGGQATSRGQHHMRVHNRQHS